ncbi:hypothetical protein PDESU_01020 [Pontiella desulfatans]|uniref:Uncharacterized protein n=1 Tax=Pontiella desulfatans TaxID=2750659 RepID=A0A6C2TXZ8_PONDE|nr:hypothetical protein [Pontiella desulfatans]VGO12467.1 hypothetical protein PDESU_01020 [Pontiella desulfatans]
MIAALIALIALLMLGGAAGSGWTADLEKNIKHAVEDEDRREAVLEATGAHMDGMKEVAGSVTDHFVQLLETHIDFESTGKDFDAVAQQLKADQAKGFALDLKTLKAMKANLTPEEWNAVFTKDQK